MDATAKKGELLSLSGFGDARDGTYLVTEATPECDDLQAAPVVWTYSLLKDPFS